MRLHAKTQKHWRVELQPPIIDKDSVPNSPVHSYSSILIRKKNTPQVMCFIPVGDPVAKGIIRKIGWWRLNGAEKD